ncbi:glycosyl hydrolase [Aliidongia dinghuensis]|uniref:Glycosyl hydrolase n=1 Tax=Aliidongia dinghuensis TaxID=1867774 RepID=A0A8J2YZS3_9PROT|nr:exo-alpha-sialidase [Aliidongia dinghuensis]GGF44288.1 glycosyl hydrolase [Aliidongia dinghuensis]
MSAVAARPALRLDGIIRPAAGDPVRTDAFLPSPAVQNHAANLMVLGNGDLACVWFGGTQEGIPDISIYFSRLAAGADTWSPAERLSDDPTRSEQNPVLFLAPDGRLWLLYTSQRSGNQDTSIVKFRISDDHGRSWGPVGTLIDEPGTFIRQPITVLENGDWLLPVFLCRTRPGEKWVGDDDVSAVKISSDQGRTWSHHEVPGSLGAVHMNIVPLGDGTLLALYRSRWADRIHLSRSSDGGRSWSAPEPTELPNNNSSIQVTRLANGHLALAYNHMCAEWAPERRQSLYDEIEDDEPTAAAPASAAPRPAGRTAFWGAPRAPMTVALSEDGGRTWPIRRDIELGDGYCMTNNSRDGLNRELSYPSIREGADGALHVAFTYHRQAIKHVRIDEAWIRAGGPASD